MRPFPVSLVQSISSLVIESFSSRERLKINSNKLDFHVHVVLGHLFHLDSRIYIPLSLEKGARRGRKGLLSQDKIFRNLSRRYLRLVVRFLEEEEYIEVFEHSFSRVISECYQTSIEGKKKLNDLFRRYSNWEKYSDRNQHSFSVEIRQGDELDSDLINERKTILENYTELLGKVKIRSKYRVFNAFHFYCVFNRSLDFGGRLYNNAFLLTKEERKSFSFDSEKTCELDYSSLHIVLLYNRAGVDIEKSDLYDIPGFSRNDIKIALLTIINAKNKNQAIKSFVYRRSKTWPYLEKDQYVENLKQTENYTRSLFLAIERWHLPINKFFYTGEGVSLMREDSDILFSVLSELTNKEIPVLSFHDSFVCKKEHKLIVYKIMLKELKKRLNIKVRAKLVK